MKHAPALVLNPFIFGYAVGCVGAIRSLSRPLWSERDIQKLKEELGFE